MKLIQAQEVPSSSFVVEEPHSALHFSTPRETLNEKLECSTVLDLMELINKNHNKIV